jgi:hypothetical protein
MIALTVVNVAVMIVTLAERRPMGAQEVAPVLRGRALEIVDTQGRVRASLNVMPASTSAAGDPYPETVLLRLITERGRPSVKISSAEPASGLSFAGPTGTNDTWLTLGAKGQSTSLKLKDENGREREITP